MCIRDSKLADKLTPRQFAELAGLDYEAAQVVYAAYAAENESYGELVGNIATYKVPLIDMFLYEMCIRDRVFCQPRAW